MLKYRIPIEGFFKDGLGEVWERFWWGEGRGTLDHGFEKTIFMNNEEIID